MQMTPLMSLSVFAIFALMIPLITIANSNKKATVSSAATSTPTPAPMDEMMEY